MEQIFTYGNRNPQGMALELSGNRIWMHEHGPRGGDELNILQSGANYGWPVTIWEQVFRHHNQAINSENKEPGNNAIE